MFEKGMILSSLSGLLLLGPLSQRLRRPWSEDQSHSGGGPKNLIAEEAEGTEQLGGLYLLNRRDE